MSLTVGEVKENADYNLAATGQLGSFQYLLGAEQLSNYNKAIELGAQDEDNWYDWEEQVTEL